MVHRKEEEGPTDHASRVKPALARGERDFHSCRRDRTSLIQRFEREAAATKSTQQDGVQQECISSELQYLKVDLPQAVPPSSSSSSSTRLEPEVAR